MFCFAFRRKAWAVFIWVPIVSAFAYGTYLILRRFSVIGKGDSMAGAFAGMENLFLLQALGICVAGLVAAIFCRPRKEAWRPSTVIPTVMLCLALILVNDYRNTTRVEIQLFDAKGNPLPNVRVQYSLSEGGIRLPYKVLLSDARGKFDFSLRRNQEVGLGIMPRQRSSDDIETSPTFWNLGIEQLKSAPSQLALRHSWQRSVANQTLNEGFIEIMPRSREIRFPLTLPDHASLDPTPRRERIRAAFASFRQSHPQSLSYAYVCGSVEAIEFVPAMLEAYRNKEPGSEGVVDGLAQIAEILVQLDGGCQEVQRRLGHQPDYPREMLQNQIAQFCTWAGVPEENRADRLHALAQVREKIASHAGILVDFALEQLPQDRGVLKVLSELQQLAKPHLPRIIAALLNHPPADMQAASNLSHPLSMMGAHIEDLEALLDSDNPLLVIIGCQVARDATSDSALEHDTAARLLARLEATRPQITGSFAGRCSDNLLQNLQTRLKQATR